MWVVRYGPPCCIWTSGITYQVVVGEVGNVARFDTKVLECLGLRIDDLINELALDLIGRQRVPPKSLVKHTGDGLENSLWNVEMSPLLKDFLVYHLGDLCHAILLGTVELKGLAGSRVVVQHLLKCHTDINGLHRLAYNATFHSTQLT